jgi:hypothetical protein
MIRKSITALNSTEKREITVIEAGEFLDPKGCSDFLAAMGLKMSKTTLDCAVSRGNGPLYVHFNKRRYYRRADVLAWVNSQTAKTRTSSSDCLDNSRRSTSEAA